MQSVHLQRKLMQHLKDIGLRLSQPQMTNLALWSQALAVSADCHLTNLALGLPIEGRRENLVQRLRRFLKQRQLGWHGCYGQLVRHLFAHWQGREVALVMDRTDLGQRWSILMLGAAYHKRLLPLTWRLLPFGGTGAQAQQALLSQVRPHLPPHARIHFYGDCEFRSVAVQACCHSFGWHWHLGVKSDAYVQLADGGWTQLRDLPLSPGERRYWQAVYLTQQHPFGASQPYRRLVDQPEPSPLLGDRPSRRCSGLASRPQTFLDRTHLPRLEELWLRPGAEFHR